MRICIRHIINKIMTKEQLIKIAEVGFSDEAKEFMHLDRCEILEEDAFRFLLYDPKRGFDENNKPFKIYLWIYIDKEFVQFTCNPFEFNTFAAVREINKMELI